MTGLPFGFRSWLTGTCLFLCCCGCNRGGGTPAATQSPPAPASTESQPTNTSNVAPSAVEPQSESPGSTNAPTTLPDAGATQGHPPGILFADSFADVTGSIKRHEHGMQVAQGPRTTRLVHFFMAKFEEGVLKMQVHEDAATNGPDDRPGVLALSWQELPPSLPYSGYVYLGGSSAERRMTLLPLQQATSVADLEMVRLKFRFKGLKADNAGPAKIAIGCRLEPSLPDSYAKRLDLGRIVATEEWGAFDVALSEGKNTENFLRAIAEEKATAFKLVWAQASPIKDYQAGDTLLLDDLEISNTRQE